MPFKRVSQHYIDSVLQIIVKWWSEIFTTLCEIQAVFGSVNYFQKAMKRLLEHFQNTPLSQR